VSSAPIRLLAVCSHNRTRSVMMAALLDSLLTSRSVPVAVRSSGFGPAGLPAIDDAIDAMARRGLDISAHRSRPTTAALVEGADVIVAAQRDHVVKIAALSPEAFPRAMTLPELVERATDADPTDVDDVRTWVGSLTAGRTASDYLRAAVPEVADPTGSPPRVFESAVAVIERQCTEAADLIAAVAASGRGVVER
jgi:protein-tyrosine phosphatase